MNQDTDTELTRDLAAIQAALNTGDADKDFAEQLRKEARHRYGLRKAAREAMRGQTN